MLNNLTSFAPHLPFILVGIIGIGAVIAFHELGHFIFCKLFNVYVPSFSIGFGPQLFQKKWGETTFSLSLIPIGGYVEAEMGQTASIESERHLDTKPYWQKLLIAFGGILFNLIFSYVILVGLSMSGIPANPFLIHHGSYSIKKIKENSPAHEAKLQSGDQILKINDHEVTHHVGKLFEALEPLAHQKVTITFKRADKIKIVEVILSSRDAKGKKIGILGIEEFDFPSLPATSFLKALIQGIKLTKELIIASFNGLSQAFKSRSAENFSGPLMMISLTVASAKKGISLLLIFLVVISITLAVINLIPLPILDGGRIFTFTLEAIIRRPLPDAFHVGMHYLSWILMIVLFIFLMIKDIKHLFLS